LCPPVQKDMVNGCIAFNSCSKLNTLTHIDLKTYCGLLNAGACTSNFPLTCPARNYVCQKASNSNGQKRLLQNHWCAIWHAQRMPSLVFVAKPGIRSTGRILSEKLACFFGPEVVPTTPAKALQGAEVRSNRVELYVVRISPIRS
jgi:hypothetical protein